MMAVVVEDTCKLLYDVRIDNSRSRITYIFSSSRRLKAIEVIIRCYYRIEFECTPLSVFIFFASFVRFECYSIEIDNRILVVLRM